MKLRFQVAMVDPMNGIVEWEGAARALLADNDGEPRDALAAARALVFFAEMDSVSDALARRMIEFARIAPDAS